MSLCTKVYLNIVYIKEMNINTHAYIYPYMYVYLYSNVYKYKGHAGVLLTQFAPIDNTFFPPFTGEYVDRSDPIASLGRPVSLESPRSEYLR